MPQGIYVIENTVTGDFYVGSTRALEKRRRRHFRELEQGIHHSAYLQRAYAKYGVEAFTFKVIEEVLNPQMLILREQHWIETLHPTYNMNPLATNSLGMKVSEKVKATLLQNSLNRTFEERSRTLTGKKRTEETKRKQSEAAYARKKPTEETRKILSEAAKRRVYTEEGRKKRSAMMKTRHAQTPMSEETRKRNADGNKRFVENLTEEQKRIRSHKARNRPPVTEETRRKMSEAAKNRRRTPRS